MFLKGVLKDEMQTGEFCDIMNNFPEIQVEIWRGKFYTLKSEQKKIKSITEGIEIKWYRWKEPCCEEHNLDDNSFKCEGCWSYPEDIDEYVPMRRRWIYMHQS